MLCTDEGDHRHENIDAQGGDIRAAKGEEEDVLRKEQLGPDPTVEEELLGIKGELSILIFSPA